MLCGGLENNLPASPDGFAIEGSTLFCHGPFYYGKPKHLSIHPLRPLPGENSRAILGAMDIHMPDNRPTARDRMLSSAAAGQQPTMLDLSAGKSPLGRRLNPIQADWLLRHAVDRYRTLWNDLGIWRNKMNRWEEMSEGIYTSRIGQPNMNDPEYKKDVFAFSNDTLGVVDGFVDFVTAQAIHDIFATDPWMQATPDGPGSSNEQTELAEIVSKHCQWKFNQSNIKESCKDAIRVAVWGGTAFIKPRWNHCKETYVKAETCAHSISGDCPLLNQAGDYIRNKEDIPEDIDGDDIEWREIESEETVVAANNVDMACLDFRDVAFDQTAAQLDLMHTDFFSRTRMGLLDLAEIYNLTDEQVHMLRLAYVQPDEEVRYRRGETAQTQKSTFGNQDEANPLVSVVEGFMRCDPMHTGQPITIHVIFSPELYILFSLDYLRNVTPDGILPVFPVRVHKLARRIFGKGYFEKFENANNSVDRQYNAIIYRNNLAANVISGIDPTQFAKPSDVESVNLLADTSKPLKLSAEGKLGQAVQFLQIPDANNRADELMNDRVQMMQMNSGITSAAQGELSGVPSANTATGVNQLTSRGALLVASPIDQMVEDIQPAVEFCSFLVYDNQDSDEAFMWGEGKESKLLSIRAGDVKGLRAKVELSLVQAQNQQKLQSGQTAAAAIIQYIGIPEADKSAVRPLFVQIISALGFHNAEEIVREAAVDPASMIAMLPPEQQGAVQAALQAAGIIPPPETQAAPGEPAAAPEMPAGPPATENFSAPVMRG